MSEILGEEFFLSAVWLEMFCLWVTLCLLAKQSVALTEAVNRLAMLIQSHTGYQTILPLRVSLISCCLM